jgi:hypothetical protein
MTSIATNSKNDIFAGPDGNLALTAPGVATVIQDCQHAMQGQLGEMTLDLPNGVPTLETVWNNWNPAQFSAYARRVLAAVPNVIAVKQFSITREGDVASYVALIQSAFGLVPITGTLTRGS